MVLLTITWALLGLLLGVSSFVLIPWLLAFLGGVEMRDTVGRYFVDQTMTVLGDAALLAREQGGVALAGVSFDSDFGADEVTVAGKTGHIKDDLGLKSRLSGASFGISMESHPVYISPLFAEFAERAADAVHSDRLGPQADGGMRLDFEIAREAIMPELRGAYRILDGDARLHYSRLAESWAQKSQEKFGKRVSLGQTLLLIAAFAVGSGMGFLVMKYGASGSGGVTVPVMIAGLAVAPRLPSRRQVRMGGAVAAVALLLAAVAAGAFVGWGLIAAGAFVGAALVGAFTPPALILAFREGLPNLVAVGLIIAAQIAFGNAVLVRRADGTYEWTVLRDLDGDTHAELDSGDSVPVDVGRGELFAFGFGRLAVTEEKRELNLEPWTVTAVPGDSGQAIDHRAGVPVAPPRSEQSDSWLVSLSTIQRAIRGSASSALIRRGRDKALDEKGGQQQLSQLWTMGFATALLIVGFGMTAGVLML